MYCMYVKLDNKWLSVEELQNGLKAIHNDVKKRKIYNPVNNRVQILTSDVRSTWAANREKVTNGKLKMYNIIYLKECVS